LSHCGTSRSQDQRGIISRRDCGLRFIGRYAVYYKPFSDALVIVRIIHGARDIAAIAERGGFEEGV
jgi:plasmid stabilization system protein ParE